MMSILIDWFVLVLIAGVVYINYHYDVIVNKISYLLVEVIIAIVAIFFPDIALLISILMYFFLTSYDLSDKKFKHKNYNFISRIFRKFIRLIIIICLAILLIIIVIIMSILQYEFKYNHVRIADYFKKYKNFGIVILFCTAIYNISKYARIKCDNDLLDKLLKNIINSIYNTNISNVNISFIMKHHINNSVKSNKDIKNAISFCNSLKDRFISTYNNAILFDFIDTCIQVLRYKYSNNKNNDLTLWELLSKSLFEVTLAMSVILKIWTFNNMANFMTIIIMKILPFSIVITVILFVLVNFITYQIHFIDRGYLYNLKDATNLIKHNIL